MLNRPLSELFLWHPGSPVIPAHDPPPCYKEKEDRNQYPIHPFALIITPPGQPKVVITDGASIGKSSNNSTALPYHAAICEPEPPTQITQRIEDLYATATGTLPPFLVEHLVHLHVLGLNEDEEDRGIFDRIREVFEPRDQTREIESILVELSLIVARLVSRLVKHAQFVSGEGEEEDRSGFSMG
ncbi:hypothetical protein LTS08_007872 [Lithohypha guttulata]|nr:hypothetical protein LTS08_007872 [Lithohypha guttulata]